MILAQILLWINLVTTGINFIFMDTSEMERSKAFAMRLFSGTFFSLYLTAIMLLSRVN